jgi:hypothetical protein
MSYTIERLPDVPVVIASWSRDFTYARDISHFALELTALLDEQPDRVNLIVNMGDPTLSIADVFDCMKLVDHSTDSVYFHSQLTGICWVTRVVMLLEAAHAVSIPVFGDLDQALEAIRGRV